MTAAFIMELRDESEREEFITLLRRAPILDANGKTVMVQIKRRKTVASDEAKRLMWSMLGDLEKQVPWPVDGELQYLAKEDWKDICTAGLKRNQRVAQGIEGGFVMLGDRTSDMSVQQMHELIEFTAWFGSQQTPQVKWSIYPPVPKTSGQTHTRNRK